LSLFMENICEMRRTALALGFLALLIPFRPGQAESESQDVLGKLSITQQNWRHSGKLLIVDIAFRNDNPFPLKSVVVSCKIIGDPARPQDSRGVTIRQNLSRGDTTVSGIEFPVTHDKALEAPARWTRLSELRRGEANPHGFLRRRQRGNLQPPPDGWLENGCSWTRWIPRSRGRLVV
jgi:hypothetical protein